MPNPGKGPTLFAALLAVAALSGAPAPAESPAGPAATPPTDQEIDAWFARIPAGEAAQVEEEVRGRIAALEGTPHADAIVMTHLLSVLSLALALGGKASDPATMALAERNLALTERVVGTEHQLYARALTDCSRVALQGGNYPIARGYAERSLALRERLLPAGDPSIGRALVSLGTVVQKAGDPNEGRRLMERGLAIYEKAEKVDPLWIPAGNMTLGILLIDLRELDEAEMRLTRARDGLTSLYGEKNPHVANAINALGIVHELKGDLVRARDDYERALAIQVAVLPSENPYIAGILHNLSLVSHNMGDTAAAADFERRALAMSEKTWGPDHQETLRGRHALGIYLGALGESEEAERFLAAALAGREKSLGPDHFDTAESLAGLADLYVDTGRAEEALPLLLRALAVRETALGPDHPIVALSLSSLSRCEARLGRREAARLHSGR
ncbi:MAG TPA: tetratricopeptide repeat protein, partial [Candidatus Polarisedimenticolia bacterium]|nr:tetratricopeptide repeat protein [Candidatus Polarisedimenticolia bacterium]